MTDYSKMSVHDLLGEARNYEFMWSVEDAIRKAVIREASVGTCRIGMGFDMRLDENCTKTADGEYYLIPKVTP